MYNLVTKSDAVILKYFTYDETKNTSMLHEDIHTGVDIQGQKVYSMSPGTVILVGYDGKYKNVIIRLDEENCFNYAHLTDTDLRYNEDVEEGTFIGHCDSFVHFEHGSRQQTLWPIRIGTLTYFKKDPMYVLENSWESVKQIDESQIDELELSGPMYINTDTQEVNKFDIQRTRR